MILMPSMTNSSRTRLEKFDVANHISGRQQIMDQHEGAEHVGDGGLLRSVDNALMGKTCLVQPQKVRILHHNHTTFFSCALKVSFIFGRL